jgi:hypothetical protein
MPITPHTRHRRTSSSPHRPVPSSTASGMHLGLLYALHNCQCAASPARRSPMPPLSQQWVPLLHTSSPGVANRCIHAHMHVVHSSLLPRTFAIPRRPPHLIQARHEFEEPSLPGGRWRVRSGVGAKLDSLYALPTVGGVAKRRGDEGGEWEEGERRQVPNSTSLSSGTPFPRRL